LATASPKNSRATQSTIPVFYQGQCFSYVDAEPDHYITRDEFERGKRNGHYLSMNHGKAALKLGETRPKFPALIESVKARWKDVGTNNHSFSFRRDYGALQQRLGPTVRMLLR
jgi:hypothetical protein